MNIIESTGGPNRPEKLKFGYSKLVRAKILPRMQAEGSTPSFGILKRSELITELNEKLVEESEEIYSTSPDSLLSELADLQEVIDTLSKLDEESFNLTDKYQEQINWELTKANLTINQLRQVQYQKLKEDGGFEEGVYIETIEIPADNPRVEHYLANPDRYPKIEAA